MLKHMSRAEVEVHHATPLWEASYEKNIIFLFPVTKVSFESYISEIIPGRDRTWGGEGGHGTCTAHPKVLQLLHIAAFKSQRNFCNGHAGIWDAVLRHNRTMCWLQFYGLWVIQDPKMHNAVIKVPTVFKAPPPHPLETYRRCCSFSGSCSIPSYHLLLYIYFGAGNWSTVKNGTGHIQRQEIDPLKWNVTYKIKGSGQKDFVGMIGNFRHGLEKMLGLDCAHQHNRLKDQAWK